jgi:Domain of unknown function (DUF1816)
MKLNATHLTTLPSIFNYQTIRPGKVFPSAFFAATLTVNNKLPVKMTEFWTNILSFLGRAWWIEVLTTQPKCLYYFGPFADAKEAAVAMEGYVEDLENESSQGIQTQIKRCKPDHLTIEYDD